MIETATGFLIGWNKFSWSEFKVFLRTKNSVLILVLFLIGLIAPFSYMMVPFTMEGWFGYKFMKGFLWQMGFPVSFIMFGMILSVIGRAYISKPNEIKPFLSAFSFVILMIGSFFFVMGFFEMSRKWNLIIYYVIVLILSLGLVSFLLLVARRLQVVEQSLRDPKKVREMIRSLTDLISDIRKSHYFRMGKKGIDRTLTKDEFLKDTELLDKKIVNSFKSLNDV